MKNGHSGYLTPEEAVLRDLTVELFTPSPAGEPMATVHGEMRFDRWLESERLRISADPRRAAEIVSRDGLLTLYVNKPAGRVGKLEKN